MKLRYALLALLLVAWFVTMYLLRRAFDIPWWVR